MKNLQSRKKSIFLQHASRARQSNYVKHSEHFLKKACMSECGFLLGYRLTTVIAISKLTLSPYFHLLFIGTLMRIAKCTLKN